MILPSTESSVGAFSEAEVSAARTESPLDVVRRYLGCLNDGDFEGMLSLLDDGDVLNASGLGLTAHREATVLLAYASRMAADLRVTIENLDAEGSEVRVTLTARSRVDDLLGLSRFEETLVFRVEDGIIREELHLVEGARSAARSRERKAAAAPFVTWLSQRYPEQRDDLVRPGGSLRVYDRSLLGARRRARRQIELLEEFLAESRQEEGG